MIQSPLGLAALACVVLALEWPQWRRAALPTRLVALGLTGLAVVFYLLLISVPDAPRPVAWLVDLLQPFAVRED